ncbi:Subunit of heteropentameric Replication factor C (RF-C), partial [Coemansia aciculifera]
GLRAAWNSADSNALRTIVDELIYSGYPASQVLAQLHDRTMEDQQLGSLQKAKIALVMATVDKSLCDGADEQLQLLDLMMQASQIAQRA